MGVKSKAKEGSCEVYMASGSGGETAVQKTRGRPEKQGANMGSASEGEMVARKTRAKQERQGASMGSASEGEIAQ